jgi:tetratricopeptide (TPR) repeat protein
VSGHSTDSPAGSRRALSPDRLVELEEERDFLLASLADLEAEHAAGDLDDADFEQLHADYTVRTADLIRQIEDRNAKVAAAGRPRSTGTTIAWIVGLLIFAVGAGWLLAQAVGERGIGDELTGAIDASPRQRVFECQQLDQQGAIQEANECFSDVLVEDPRNVEALTYRGWLLVRTAGSAQRIGADDEAAEILISAKASLDEAIEIDPSYPDARAFRFIVYNAEGDVDAACAEYDALVALDPPPFMLQLVESAEGFACV